MSFSRSRFPNFTAPSCHYSRSPCGSFSSVCHLLHPAVVLYIDDLSNALFDTPKYFFKLRLFPNPMMLLLFPCVSSQHQFLSVHFTIFFQFVVVVVVAQRHGGENALVEDLSLDAMAKRSWYVTLSNSWALQDVFLSVWFALGIYDRLVLKA